MAHLWKLDGPITRCLGWSKDDIDKCDSCEESRGGNVCIHRRVHRERDHDLAQCLKRGEVE